MLITTPITFDGSRAPVTFQGPLDRNMVLEARRIADRWSVSTSMTQTVASMPPADVGLVRAMWEAVRRDLGLPPPAFDGNSPIQTVGVAARADLQQWLARNTGISTASNRTKWIIGAVIGVAVVGTIGYFVARKR